MKPEDFASRLAGEEPSGYRFPGLVDAVRGLENENKQTPVLFGGGKIRYSRHVNQNIRKSSAHIIMECHKDHIDYKDSC